MDAKGDAKMTKQEQLSKARSNAARRFHVADARQRLANTPENQAAYEAAYQAFIVAHAAEQEGWLELGE
jgi:ABC-type proline/glycine betaine transport system substrate-binding protein